MFSAPVPVATIPARWVSKSRRPCSSKTSCAARPTISSGARPRMRAMWALAQVVTPSSPKSQRPSGLASKSRRNRAGSSPGRSPSTPVAMSHYYRTGEDAVVDIDLLGSPRFPTFGLDTFGDIERDPSGGPDGPLIGHPDAIRQVVAEAVLADH